MNSGFEGKLPLKASAKDSAANFDPVFDALRRSRVVEDFLDAFAKGTGIQLQFLPAAAQSRVHNPEPNILHLAMPVVIADKHTATIASEAIRCSPDHEDRAAQKAFGTPNQMPVVTETEYLGLERLLNIFAQHISAFANRHLVTPRRQEPRSITHAREYIRQHAHEPLTSDQVAKKVNVCLQHFCKLFHQTTGMTFTEYLSRVRVEIAQQKVRDQALRISEVAYDSGFESISQFNRAFRRYLGTTPTAWRKSAFVDSPRSPRRESGDLPNSKESKK